MMAVSPDITAVEMDYARSVLGKTYTSLLKNELDLTVTEDYCDPYCRTITDITIVNNTLTSLDEVVETSRQDTGGDNQDDCTATLQLTFEITGTYVGCEDTEFPGLFSPGRRQLIDVKQPQLRFDVNRALQQEKNDMDGVDSRRDMEEVTCPSCSDDESTLGFVSPTLDGVQTLLSDFVAVLPGICEVTSADVVPAKRF
jgi:hypothetical protein